MNIKHVTEKKIIYKRRIGAYGVENKSLMEHFKTWLNHHHLLTNESVILAIPRDNPQTTEPKNCRYDVALIVDSFDAISQLDIELGVLKAGKYVVFTIDHTEEAIIHTMQHMFSEIVKQGYSIDINQPIIERYALKMVENNQCEIYVPII